MSAIFRPGQRALQGYVPTPGNTQLVTPRQKGGGVTPLDPDTTLFFNFGKNKNLIDEINATTLTFARASSAWYYDSGGKLTEAPINQPRFDHDPDTLESLGLLIEEARENTLLWSTDFSQAEWVKTRTVVETSGIGPDGSAMPLMRDSNAGGLNSCSFHQGANLVAGDHSFTVFARAGTMPFLAVEYRTFGGGPVGVTYFDLVNGLVGSVGADHTASITKINNDIWKCEVFFSSVAPDSGLILLFMAPTDGQLSQVPNDGTSTLNIWGAQLEVGDFPTSPIVTAGSSVTRAREQCESTDFSWFNQSGPGTIYVESMFRHVTQRNNVIFAIGNATADNFRALLSASTLAASQCIYDGGGVNGITTVNSAYADNVFLKVAAAVDTNDLRQAANTMLSALDTSVSLNNKSVRWTVGGVGGAGSFQGSVHIKVLAYANVRKDDAFLQSVTAP